MSPVTSRAVRVLSVEGRVLVQDAGRPGLAHLGVPRAGWLDPVAAGQANRLVGNPGGAAVLECLPGGLVLELGAAMTAAVTGGGCEVRLGGRPVPHGAAVSGAAGELLEVGRVDHGVRCWVGLAGGVQTPAVLGSRSRDTLAGVGPAPLEAGDLLHVGPPGGPPSGAHVLPRVPRLPAVLRWHPGPRADWFADPVGSLAAAPYHVLPDSDRVALRLTGTPLRRRRPRELPSEGVVQGAVQVPSDGQPLVFLADHPTTGGYPVVGVVDPADLWQCAQLRPGDPVLLTPVVRR